MTEERFLGLCIHPSTLAVLSEIVEVQLHHVELLIGPLHHAVGTGAVELLKGTEQLGKKTERQHNRPKNVIEQEKLGYTS